MIFVINVCFKNQVLENVWVGKGYLFVMIYFVKSVYKCNILDFNIVIYLVGIKDCFFFFYFK